jgi:CubicO group peptidase (beta-lactamase class C family)
VIVGMLAWWMVPGPPRLGPGQTGDPALAGQVRQVAAERGYRWLSVATIEGGQVRFAGLGDSGNPSAPLVTPETAFEIGSVGKPLTGMLLADLNIPQDRTLAEIYPGIRFDDPDTAAITLGELASHRSGLPRLPPMSPPQAARSRLEAAGLNDPYTGLTRESILDSLAHAQTGPGPHGHSYSNFGYAVLGYAVAEASGTDFPSLLDARILTPLVMDHTTFGAPPGAAVGGTANGPEASRWTASGMAPAGSGLWSTSPDLARLLSAAMAGKAPGQAATAPRFDAGAGRRVGYGWVTERFGDREVVWHNGGTGGFRSFVAYEPTTGRGVVVLGNTDRGVDGIGLRLMDLPTHPGTTAAPRTGKVAIVITMTLLGFAAISALSSAWQAVRPGPRSDRLQLLSGIAAAIALLATAYEHGDWLEISRALWNCVAGLVAACAVIAVWRGRQLPTIAGNQRVWLRWLSFAVSFGLAALLVTLMAR